MNKETKIKELANQISELQAPYIEYWTYAQELIEGGHSLLKTHPNLAFGCINLSNEITEKIVANYPEEIAESYKLGTLLFKEL